MDTISTVFKTVSLLIGGVLSFLFGDFTLFLRLLVAFVTFDYITGVMVSINTGTFNWNSGFKGITKKVFIFIVVALAHLADQMFNVQTPLLQDATIFWYGANEFLSILKNGSALGVPIPSFMEKAALAAKEKSEGENINGK